MAIKFQRNYRVVIQTPEGEQILIEPNISAKIQIKRTVLSSVNNATVTIYNLAKPTRSRIFKDRYEIITYWQIQIYGGYGTSLILMFQGNITEAQSAKTGTDWVTTIQASDGMYAIQNGITSQTIASGTTISDSVGKIIKDMPNVLLGAIGESGSGTSDRGQALFGPSSEQLSKLTDDSWFIDNEVLNILGDDEYLSSTEVLYLDSKQLLATPQRSETLLLVTVLFEPLAQVGGIAEVNSVETVYNGQYKIIGIEHTVDFSQAQDGTAKTVLQLNAGEKLLRGV